MVSIIGPTIIEPTGLEHALVAVLVGLGIFAVFRSQPRVRSTHFDTPTRIATYWANAGILFLAGAIPVALWLLAGRSLTGLGFRRGSFNVSTLVLTLTFLAGFALLGWWRLSGPRLARSIERWQRDVPFLPTNGLEGAHFTVLALAAGVFEEVLFRGFFIPYTASVAGSSGASPSVATVLAIVLPALGFGFVHRYQGWREMTVIFVLGLFFGAISVTSASLLIPIVLHFLIDLVAGWIAVFVRPRSNEGGSSPDHTNEPVATEHRSVASGL